MDWEFLYDVKVLRFMGKRCGLHFTRVTGVEIPGNKVPRRGHEALW